jgi:hypothetical protein
MTILQPINICFTFERADPGLMLINCTVICNNFSMRISLPRTYLRKHILWPSNVKVVDKVYVY